METGKLEKLCSAQYVADESGITVTVYRITDEAFMWEVDSIIENGLYSDLSERILGILGLFDGSGYLIPPGAQWTTYTVERVSVELIIVVETASLNV